jgi:DNA-binding CsgD family transcriptional regulator/tetratricopeptide (TPR) repeat protein
MGTGLLHGRQAEIDQLAQAVRVTAAGSGAAILLEGPAGIGKTALLRTARDLAASSGFVVCAGECDELDRITPLAPLLTALRSSAPPLVDVADQQALRSATEPMWAVERLGAILDKASARQPVLVTVDDVQWADQTTVLSLSVLPAWLFAVPVLWVLARRTNPASPQVQTLTERISRAGGVVRPVEPVSPEGALAIASDILGATPDRQLSGRIDQAAGNPFYLVELLNSLRDSRAVQVRGGVARLIARDVPERFRSAVAAHIRPLSDPARRLVDVASILGRQFSPGDVAALTGEPVGRLLGAIEEARRAGILVDEGDSLAFRHDLLREAIYHELPGSVRQALHRDAASALLARGASWASVASHAAVSAVPGDEEAVRALEQAAAELRGPNPGAAADLACQALGLRAPGDPDRPARAAQAVDMLAWAGRPDEAVPLAEEILATRPLEPNVEATLLASIRLSNIINGGRTSHLPPLPPRLLADPALAPTLARTLKLIDAVGRQYEDFDGANRVCTAVADEAEAADDEVSLAIARRVGTFFPAMRGDLMDSLHQIEVAVAAADRGSAEVKRTMPRLGLGLTLFALDRIDDALQTLGRVLSEAQLYSRSLVAQAEAFRARVLLSAGRLDEALVEADSAATEAEDARMPYPPAGLLWVRAEVGLRRGDTVAARAAAKGMASLTRTQHAAPDDHWVIARVAEAEGQPGHALEAMAESLSALATGHFFFGVPNFDDLPRLVSLVLRAGDPTTAETVASAAATLADRNPGVPGIAAAAAHCAGLLERSEPYLRQAVSTLVTCSRPLAAADAMEDLASVLEARREGAEAIDTHQSAYETYSRIGATGDAARVREKLRRLGIIRPQPADQVRRGWGSLSPAELAVVQVVAEGMTSKAAAEHLYLSVNTVNTHLRHAFTKLGVRSRVELTRIVLAHQPPIARGSDAIE